MTYNATLGAMALSAQGSPGYTGTTLPTVNDANSAVGNYKLGASGVVPTGGLNVNTINIGGAYSFAFGSTTSTDVLNIGANGLMKGGSTTNSNIGSVVDEGRLTAGGAAPVGTVPLYIFNGQNANPSLTINSRIIDNGASPIRLIINNYNGGFTALTNGANSYSGGTVVNGWVSNGGPSGGLVLTGAAGQVVVPPGGITLNNGNLTMVTNAGQINSANTVAVNAGSVFTLVGNNTLAGLTFDNYGGITAGTVTTGGVLTLTGSITASSNNVSTLPVINGTLDFGGTARTLTINPIQYNGVTLTNLQPTLNIAAIIQNAGKLTVSGGGNLQLSGASTFTGGVDLTAGGLVIGASSTPSALGTTAVTSGPLGTGTLTASAGTTLLASAASTLANPPVVQGNLNFAGLNNLTFNRSNAVVQGTDFSGSRRTACRQSSSLSATTARPRSGPIKASPLISHAP